MAPLIQADQARQPDPDDRDEQTLCEALEHPQPAERRQAVRALATRPDTEALRLSQLQVERDHNVRSALFSSLESGNSDIVIDGMIELLRSEDAELRAGAVAVLQTHPQGVEKRLETLLEDPDSDVRIMSLDVLQALPHEQTPLWLLQVLERDTHPNVLGTALDRLMEAGDERALPVLARLRLRMAQEPYLVFAIDAARRRIEGVAHG